MNDANEHVPFELGEVRFALSCGSKLRGLLHESPSKQAIVLAPCRDIHTFGMDFPIDVAFVSSSGKVVETYRSVGVGRRLRSPDASLVVERFSRPDDPWFIEGQRVTLSVLQQ